MGAQDEKKPEPEVVVMSIDTLPTYVLAHLVHQGVMELLERDALLDAVMQEGMAPPDVIAALRTFSKLMGRIAGMHERIAKHQPEAGGD